MSRSSDKPLRKARAGGLVRNEGEPRPLSTRGYGGTGPAKDGSRGGTPPSFDPPKRGPITVKVDLNLSVNEVGFIRDGKDGRRVAEKVAERAGQKFREALRDHFDDGTLGV